MDQAVHFQILNRTSTSHLALEVDAVAGFLPEGRLTLIPSQETLIPTFGVFKFPILAFTLVSKFTLSGNPFLLFLFCHNPFYHLHHLYLCLFCYNPS
uniref:Uncharacterized protein n=1 Tax=Glycine max TaxID=3847 RepID=C6THF3_SOYBN|nr:unknown [Glycine max]